MRRLPLRSPPRVRGKAAFLPAANPSAGITPAYAGKRAASAREAYFIWDHPRVCGEKLYVFPSADSATGSPPRMRGKALAPAGLYGLTGITPAYAGKRDGFVVRFLVVRDHPRVCGEKQRTLAVQNEPQGSPPRVRGKVRVVVVLRHHFGITPACAGKSQRRAAGN